MEDQEKLYRLIGTAYGLILEAVQDIETVLDDLALGPLPEPTPEQEGL